MIIAIDFDGTCVTHDFPKVGKTVPYAVETLQDLVDAGHNLVLFTMRSDRVNMGGKLTPDIKDVTGTFLTDAVNWFKANNIRLWGVQTNPEQKEWTTSPKAYAHLYIDDSAVGCPLVYGMHTRPYVNWLSVREILQKMHVLK